VVREAPPEGLRVLHEDEHLVAVDKPSGMAAHPVGRIRHGTLVNKLHARYRHEDPAQDVVPRLAQLREIDTDVIWIGLPPSGDPVESAQYEFLNSIWRDLAEDEPQIAWLESFPLLAGPDGRYREVDDTASPPVQLYQADGRHLCPEGGRRIAVAVLALLEDRFGVEVDPAWTDTNWAFNPFAYDVGKCPHND